jgi:hypothetical protein
MITFQVVVVVGKWVGKKKKRCVKRMAAHRLTLTDGILMLGSSSITFLLLLRVPPSFRRLCGGEMNLSSFC